MSLGVTLSFCPTGQGGGVDNSCSSKGITVLKGNIGGSTGAKLVERDGQKYVMKQHHGKEGQVHSEVATNQLYNLLGGKQLAPNTELIEHNGKAAMLAEHIPDAKQLSELTGQELKDAQASVREHFALDSLLSNWDVVGLESDNILVSEAGVHRVDNGGSLEYRAQGGPKGAAFGDKVGEIDSLRDRSRNYSAAKVFGKTSDSQIRSQVAGLASRFDRSKVEAVFKQSGYSASKAKELSGKLERRLGDLKSRYLPKGVELSYVSDTVLGGTNSVHRVPSDTEGAADRFLQHVADRGNAWSPRAGSIPESVALSSDHSYGCLMAIMPPEIAESIREVQSRIDPSDVIEIENEPHVTVRYGFDASVVAADFRSILDGSSPVRLTLLKPTLFSNDNDVLKLDVFSECLHMMNTWLDESGIPDPGNSHPEHHPHLTIAYLRSGSGWKYVGDPIFSKLEGANVVLRDLVYSDADNQRTVIALSGNQAVSIAGVELGFCPTGPGGGIDNSCGKGGGGGKDKKYAIPKDLKGDGTAKDPYQVGKNIELAARLLADGKAVQLDQPKQVSTLVDKLHHMVQDAVKRGEKAPKYDLCNVSVPGTNLFCQDSLGIPRVEMPQLKGMPVPGSFASTIETNKQGEVNLADHFVSHLQTDHNIQVTHEDVKASYLRASQAQLDGVKIASMVAASKAGERDLRKGAIFITKDNYVLDGHHRWAAVVSESLGRNKDPKMPVYRVGVDIGTAIRLANDYTRLAGIQAKAVPLSLAAPLEVREAGNNLNLPLGDISEHLELPKGVKIDEAGDAIQEALDHVTSRGMNSENGREYVVSVLEEKGIQANESYLQTLVDTHNSISHAAVDRSNTLKDDDIWGYEYEANTDRHIEVDGTIAEKDDPFWDEWYPPNGYNCECKARPITVGEAIEEGYIDGVDEEDEPPDGAEPDEGFDTDFQDLLEPEEIEASFCPTGPGGGVDPTCSPSHSSFDKSDFGHVQKKLDELYKKQAEIKKRAANERKASGGAASSKTKKERSEVNKQIDELKKQLVGERKKADKPEAKPKSKPQDKPEAKPKLAPAGKLKAPKEFKNVGEASKWLSDEFKINLTIDKAKYVDKDRATELAKATADHLTHMANKFELINKYRQDPMSVGFAGGYKGGFNPKQTDGDLKLTVMKPNNGGLYSPSYNSITMNSNLHLADKSYEPRLGHHNVDFTYAGCFRHEYGHRIWGQALSDYQRSSFNHLYDKYKKADTTSTKFMYGSSSHVTKYDKLGAKVVSAYGCTNNREFWAESFCAVTSPAYKEGSLPKDVESFMYSALGKRDSSMSLAEVWIAPGVSIVTAFCPTGPGGGVDPHCSPGGADVIAEQKSVSLPHTTDHETLKYQLKNKVQTREFAKQKIKEIKAGLSKESLSKWKKVRLDANKEIKTLQQKISGTYKHTMSQPAPKPFEQKPMPFTPIPAAPKLVGQVSFVNDKGEATGVKAATADSMNHQYESWRQSLTPGERSAIHSYTGQSYGQINTGFRQNQFSSAMLNKIHSIDSGLAKAAPVKEDMLIYRKVGDSSNSIYNKCKAGDVIVERGYVSTSISRHGWSGNTVVNIKVPAGAKGAYVQAISSHKNEKEFIMPRDTMFHVVRVRTVSETNLGYTSKTRVVDAEVVVHGKKLHDPVF